MNKSVQSKNNEYESLVGLISDAYLKGQEKAVMAVNTNMVKTYWEIGQYIVEFE